MDALIRCAHELASRLRVEPPPADAIQSTLDDVLSSRDNYECARAGIITQDELVELVLAHLYTLLVKEEYEHRDDRDVFGEDLLSSVKHALF